MPRKHSKKVAGEPPRKLHTFHIQRYVAYSQTSECAIIPAEEVEKLNRKQKAIELCTALRNN